MMWYYILFFSFYSIFVIMLCGVMSTIKDEFSDEE